MTIKSKVISAIIFAAIAVELALRAAGLVDFPMYELDREIAYIPKANQSGSFLDRNDWYFNDKSMPIARNWDPSLHPNVFLIGNSIVMGGNPYRQQDKLVAKIQKRLGERPVVWPIAAGGWTQLNEMAYLARHPEVATDADYIAWEYMGGGLSGTTPWFGEYVFPTHKPVYLTWYFLRRYVLPRIFGSFVFSELPVTGSAQDINVDKFDVAVAEITHGGGQARKGIIWLYPTAAQLEEAKEGKEWLPERPQIEKIANKYGLRIVDIASNPEWNAALYRDGGVHPNVEGNEVLASILVSEFDKDKSE
ncbi:MAG: SGNH/GDSL hydrolase family protein [Roseiarcus sp.]